jgi:hypothetical protein
VTNVLFICYKNNIEYLIDQDTYLDLLIQKMDYIHLEGLGHTAFALNKAGITDGPVWDGLHEQVMKKDTFQLTWVKNNNYDPTAFEYAGLEGGFGARTVEHIG